MYLAEPAIVFTDYAIALQCVVFMLLLWRDRTLSSQFWSIGFGAIALSAVAGGTFHGIRTELPWQAQLMLWQLTLHALGIASLVTGLGTVAVSLTKRWQLIWAIALALKGLVMGVFISIRLDFFYAVADYGSTLGLVLALQLVVSTQREAPALKWVLAGIIISGVATWVLLNEFTPIATLAPEAVFHLIQMPGLYCLYRAAQALDPQNKNPQR